jgi:uncharacterized protein involved in exopolysaccharide biosynthesis
MSGTPPVDAADTGSALDYLSVLIDRWRTVAWTAFSATLFTIILTYVLAPTYTAKVVLIPASQGGGGGGGLGALGGIASRLGVSVGGSNPTDAPEFYVTLVRSREILTEVSHARFLVRNGPDSAEVMDQLGIEGSSVPGREEQTVKRLRRDVNASMDRQSQTVTLSVNAEDPRLAANIANDIAERIDRFNREKRTFQTRERRIFTEQRMAEAETELRASENALRDFRVRNRRIDSPSLEFEDGRLQRQVQVKQEVYLTLRREYETSRIAEVNDTPLLTIVDHAVPPVMRSWPRRGRLASLAMVFGIVTGIMLAFGQQYVATLAQNNDPTLAKLRVEWARLKARIRRPAQRTA